MANSKLNPQYKIFVVEDNILYAQILKKQLIDDGYQVKVFLKMQHLQIMKLN